MLTSAPLPMTSAIVCLAEEASDRSEEQLTLVLLGFGLRTFALDSLSGLVDFILDEIHLG